MLRFYTKVQLKRHYSSGGHTSGADDLFFDHIPILPHILSETVAFSIDSLHNPGNDAGYIEIEVYTHEGK